MGGPGLPNASRPLLLIASGAPCPLPRECAACHWARALHSPRLGSNRSQRQSARPFSLFPPLPLRAVVWFWQGSGDRSPLLALGTARNFSARDDGPTGGGSPS